jgi:uncharacterized protein
LRRQNKGRGNASATSRCPNSSSGEDFLKQIASRYPFHEALLFGSRARNTHTARNNAYIVVVLKCPHRGRAEAFKNMAAVAFHVMLENGVRVDALPIWPEKVEHPETFSNRL